jgi:hypothetical protein
VSFGNLVTKDGASKFVTIGTGVIVVKETPGRQDISIVTAKHIFEEGHPQSLRVRFASEEDKPLDQDTGYVLTLRDWMGNNLWQSLSDDSDVAISTMRFGRQTHLQGAITDGIFLREFAEDDEIYEGASLVIFGFPGDVSVLMGPNALVRAVTRSGTVAWTDPLSSGGPFMIDANILPGNSGSPVFTLPNELDRFGTTRLGGQPRFLGIVTSTIANSYVDSIGGLGKVEPVSRIKRLVNQLFPQM